MKTWIVGGYVYRYEKRRLERKNLCMEDGKITKICSPSEEIPEGDIFDVKGKAVVPGFIDVHTHGGQGSRCQCSNKRRFSENWTFFCRAGNYNMALLDSYRYKRANGKSNWRNAETPGKS